MFAAWKPEDHDGHDQCIVGTEQAFEGNEQTNCDEIGAGDVQDAPFILADTALGSAFAARKVDTDRIKAYTRLISS